MTIKIGTWHEKEARDVVQHTSYAADAINVRTKPGDYDLKISFKTGFSVPMPDQLHGAIDAEVTGGGYYSGFGGVNHHFEPAKLGPTTERVQMYSYHLAELIKNGTVTVDEGWEWLAADSPWKEKEAPARWDELAKMAEVSRAIEETKRTIADYQRQLNVSEYASERPAIRRTISELEEELKELSK